MSTIKELLAQYDGIQKALHLIFTEVEDREMNKRNMLADIVESVEWIWKKEYPDNPVVRDVIEALRDERVGEEELRRLGYEAYDCYIGNRAIDRVTSIAYWASYYNALDKGKTKEEAIAVQEEEREKQKGIILKWFGDL